MNTTTTARKTATVTLDLGDNDADNYVDGVACHDCVMLVANGEVDSADPAWDMDAALATQEEYTVALGEDDDPFSTATCTICDSTLAGYRHEVTLFPR